MKRDRDAERIKILGDDENRLRMRLLELLPGAVISGVPLFINSRYNPHNQPSHHLLPEAEELLTLALACLEQRHALLLSSEGSVGNLYIVACEEMASPSEHRRGPRRLAKAVLESLGNAA